MMQERVMANSSNGKTLTRLIAVLFMGLAFAGCALMLSSGSESLFADGYYGGSQQTAAR